MSDIVVPIHIINLASNYKNKSDFRYNCNSSFLLAKENKWIDVLFPPKEKIISEPKPKLSIQDCISIAKNYNTITDLRNNNNRVYNLIHKYKCTYQAFSHMSNPAKKWTLELCHAEALKYTNKKDFYTHSQPAYVCASKYKWINTICSHMSKNNEKLKPI